MKAIEIIDAILKQDITNDVASIFNTGDEPMTKCVTMFGEFLEIIPPKPNTDYVCEWRDLEQKPVIGIPNAVLIQPFDAGTMLIYLYEVEN